MLSTILGDYTFYNTGFNVGLDRGLVRHIYLTLVRPTFYFLLLQAVLSNCIIWFTCSRVVSTLSVCHEQKTHPPRPALANRYTWAAKENFTAVSMTSCRIFTQLDSSFTAPKLN